MLTFSHAAAFLRSARTLPFILSLFIHCSTIMNCNLRVIQPRAFAQNPHLRYMWVKYPVYIPVPSTKAWQNMARVQLTPHFIFKSGPTRIYNLTCQTQGPETESDPPHDFMWFAKASHMPTQRVSCLNLDQNCKFLQTVFITTPKIK